jgi:hypothetical protein
MTSVRRLGVLVLAGLLCAACSESSPRARSEPEPLPTDFINGSTCEPLEVSRLPEDSGCATEVKDETSEGTTDTLLVYALLDDEGYPRSWHTRLRTSSGTSDQPLDAGSRHSYPRAVGAADVDGDGASEWFIKTLDLGGHGTSWKQLNVYVPRANRLEVVTFEGEPLALRVGGTSRMGEGIGCDEGKLELLRAEAQNIRNTRWDASVRSFELDGSKASFVAREGNTLSLSDYNDPDLNPFYRLNCGELTYLP